MKVLHADKGKRIVLPSPAKPNSVWVPVLVTEKEIRLIAYEPPQSPEPARGQVVTGKDGWPVWDGEMVVDPVEALNAARLEDANAAIQGPQRARAEKPFGPDHLRRPPRRRRSESRRLRGQHIQP